MTTTPGTHQRIHAGTRVPTNRTQANHTDVPNSGLGGFYPCPRCTPERYATHGAKHRSDRPTELNTRPPIEQLTRLDHVHVNGQCIKDRHGTCHLKDGSDG